MQHHQHIYKIHQTIKIGYTEYGFYFYITGISAIIGGFIRLAGVAAFIITIVFFYIMGKMHGQINKGE